MVKQVDNKGITWVIKNFPSLKSAPIYSDQFIVGGCKWRLKGNNKAGKLSLYLEVPDKASLPIKWRRHAKFSLTLINQSKLPLIKETQHWFDGKEPVWGFPEMISLNKLHAKEGFLMNGDLIVVAKIDFLEVAGKLDASVESSSVIQSIDFNGFKALLSQVESVKRSFERQVEKASKSPPKNLCLKTAYINLLLSLTQTLCQSSQELSNDDISGVDAALAYLRVAGFKMDWLKKKLKELKEKKKKEEASLIRLREMDEKLQPFKKRCLDLEAQIDKEKAELLAARAPLSP